MRKFRRLPPLLRVAGILAVLFPLASVLLLVSDFLQLLMDSSRVSVIEVNLTLLGLACGFALNAYSTRFRLPDRRPFLLDSWRSQVRAIALLAALPLCGITLALVISPTLPAYGFVFAVSLLGALILVVASLWVLMKPAVG